ncbi:MAG: choice-of-anchor C family protein [Sphingomonadaceae bacterium]
MNKIKAAIASTVLALAVPMVQANALTNGSFEDNNSGDPFVTLQSGLTGWDIVGSVDLIGNYWNASEGKHSLDLNGNGLGSISQSFSTVAGTTYIVSFDIAGNPDAPGVKSLTAGVVDGGNSYTFDSTGKSHGDMGWVSKSFSFVAGSGASSTLFFTGYQGNGAYGVALDNVTVSSVPEPETYGMLLAGLGLVGAIARRKKAAK